MAKITLGYWDLRGLAEPIRYLLYHKHIDFVDKRYNFDKNEWAQDKFNLGLDFPNLPYLLDGEIKITQSTTILRYLADKYNMEGSTPQQKIRVSLAEQLLDEMRYNWRRTVYSPDFEKLKPDFVKKVPALLKQFVNFLGDRKFICGDSVAYVDFMLSEIFEFHSHLIPELVHDFPKLNAHNESVVNLPGVKEYVNSANFKRRPIIFPMAMFSYYGEEPKRV